MSLSALFLWGHFLIAQGIIDWVTCTLSVGTPKSHQHIPPAITYEEMFCANLILPPGADVGGALVYWVWGSHWLVCGGVSLSVMSVAGTGQ